MNAAAAAARAPSAAAVHRRSRRFRRRRGVERARPLVAVAALLALPSVDRDPRGAGRWFAPERWLANALFTALVTALAALTVIGTFFRGPNWSFVMPW